MTKSERRKLNDFFMRYFYAIKRYGVRSPSDVIKKPSAIKKRVWNYWVNILDDDYTKISVVWKNMFTFTIGAISKDGMKFKYITPYNEYNLDLKKPFNLTDDYKEFIEVNL